MRPGEVFNIWGHYVASKVNKTGLTAIAYLYDPGGTLRLDGVSVPEIGHGLYKYDYTIPRSGTVKGKWAGTVETADATVDQQHIAFSFDVSLENDAVIPIYGR
jgi:hypothetical protein